MHSEWIFNQIESLKIKKKINLLDFASGNGRNCIPLSKNNINSLVKKEKPQDPQANENTAANLQIIRL